MDVQANAVVLSEPCCVDQVLLIDGERGVDADHAATHAVVALCALA
jgi:hypothetical protein